MDDLGRLHKCICGRTWFAPIVLSSYTTNLSGEATVWCPNCGKRSLFATPTFDISDVKSLNHALSLFLD